MSDYVGFKYRNINDRLLDSLENSRIHFSVRARLNDPFDCKIDVAKAIERIATEENASEKELLEKIMRKPDPLNKVLARVQDGIDTLGIFSMSMSSNETLMWSHYANDHRGVSVCYGFETGFLDNEDEIFGVTKVRYEPNAITDWLRSNIGLLRDNQQDFFIGLLKMVLACKAPSWTYEQEGRIIKPAEGLFAIPRSSVKAITFGLQTSASDETLIRSVVSKHYKDVKFQRAVRADADFGIEVIEV